MKRIVCSALLLCAIVLSSWSQSNKMRIAVFDFKAKSGITGDEAAVISGFLQSDLIKLGVFDVITRKDLDVIAREDETVLSGMIADSEDRIKVGQILNVSRAVTGSVTRAFGKLYVSVDLLDMETGRIISSETITPSEDALEAEIRKLASTVSRTASDYVQKVTIEDVEALVDGKIWDKAKIKLDIYIQLQGVSPKTDALSKKISAALAEQHYQRASSLYDDDQYEGADREIDQALQFDPSKRSWLNLKKKITAELQDQQEKAAIQKQKDEAAQKAEEDRLAKEREEAEQERRDEEEKAQRRAERHEERERALASSGYTLAVSKFMTQNTELKDIYPEFYGATAYIDLSTGPHFSWVVGLSLNGFNGNEARSEDLTWRGLSSHSIFQGYGLFGFRLHYALLSFLDLYGMAAVNYSMYFENWEASSGASDDVFAGAWGYDVAVGTRIFLSTKWALFGECAWYFNDFDYNADAYQTGDFSGYSALLSPGTASLDAKQISVGIYIPF